MPLKAFHAPSLSFSKGKGRSWTKLRLPRPQRRTPPNQLLLPIRIVLGGKSPSAMKIMSESSERSGKKAPDASTTSKKGGQPPNVAAGATTGEEDASKPHPQTQDLTFDEPDLPGFAKRMVRTLTRSEKNSKTPYLICRLIMLRVDGLRGPFRKQEKVNDAKQRATENLNSAEYANYVCELKIKAVGLTMKPTAGLMTLIKNWQMLSYALRH
ncbi:uncharacterized protein LOC110733212 [Chenopodium quinoa]|uniref:uncharacterized protein LOC110733212 n=1 Tax=Chenopodium quinoa TaxID=63459 RepID=UPI000B783CC4|nr:uncharacterized protein LOC110733212 [Chenopodium quinoa]